jgi:hypothetical protein
VSAMANAAAEVERITPGQRTALFAIAKTRGFSIDDLRDATPLGSISALSRCEASALLDRLNVGTAYAHPRPSVRGPRRPKGVYAIRTPAQLRKIESLRIELGWTAAGLADFLAAKTFMDGRPMSRIDSTSDGAAVIQLLLHVRDGMRRAAAACEPAASAAPNAGLTNYVAECGDGRQMVDIRHAVKPRVFQGEVADGPSNAGVGIPAKLGPGDRSSMAAIGPPIRPGIDRDKPASKGV